MFRYSGADGADEDRTFLFYPRNLRHRRLKWSEDFHVGLVGAWAADRARHDGLKTQSGRRYRSPSPSKKASLESFRQCSVRTPRESHENYLATPVWLCPPGILFCCSI